MVLFRLQFRNICGLSDCAVHVFSITSSEAVQRCGDAKVRLAICTYVKLTNKLYSTSNILNKLMAYSIYTGLLTMYVTCRPSHQRAADAYASMFYSACIAFVSLPMRISGDPDEYLCYICTVQSDAR